MAGPDVIGLGAMNMDHLYRVRSIVVDGEDVVDDFGLYPGGSAANTIFALARLGIHSGVVGMVGNDSDGKRLVEDLNSAGADTNLVRVNEQAPTGAVLALTDRAGKRSVYVAPGANNYLSPQDVDMAYLNSAGLVHLSSFVHDNQFLMIQDIVASLSSRVKLSFSPGALYVARGLKGIGPLLERTHVLFVNDREIEQLTGTGYIRGARECLRRGCEVVVVTFGQGLAVGDRRTIIAYVRDGSNEYEVESVDPTWCPIPEMTGAGDAFAAGFIFGRFRRKTLPESATIADIVARFSITQKGARLGLPSLAVLSKRYSDCCGGAL